MRVQFVTGHQGKLTGARWYEAGEEAEIEDIAAQALVAQGVALHIAPPTPPVVAPVPRGRKKIEHGKDFSYGDDSD